MVEFQKFLGYKCEVPESRTQTFRDVNLFKNCTFLASSRLTVCGEGYNRKVIRLFHITTKI